MRSASVVVKEEVGESLVVVEVGGACMGVVEMVEVGGDEVEVSRRGWRCGCGVERRGAGGVQRVGVGAMEGIGVRRWETKRVRMLK